MRFCRASRWKFRMMTRALHPHRRVSSGKRSTKSFSKVHILGRGIPDMPKQRQVLSFLTQTTKHVPKLGLTVDKEKLPSTAVWKFGMQQATLYAFFTFLLGVNPTWLLKGAVQEPEETCCCFEVCVLRLKWAKHTLWVVWNPVNGWFEALVTLFSFFIFFTAQSFFASLCGIRWSSASTIHKSYTTAMPCCKNRLDGKNRFVRWLCAGACQARQDFNLRFAPGMPSPSFNWSRKDRNMLGFHLTRSWGER